MIPSVNTAFAPEKGVDFHCTFQLTGGPSPHLDTSVLTGVLQAVVFHSALTGLS